MRPPDRTSSRCRTRCSRLRSPHDLGASGDPRRLEIDGEVCGVGAVSATGDLNLCYVRPGNERTGVGRALLLALEARAREWGVGELRLVSTATGRAFYERHGYVATGEERVPAFGLLRDYGYVKVLGGAGGAG